MYPYRIQPLTLNSSSAHLNAHLLYASRFLHIPEERAFLLHQQWQNLPLLRRLCTIHQAQLQPTAPRAQSPLPEPQRTVATARALDLHWPHDTRKDEIPLIAYREYPTDSIIVPGNLFEVFI